VAELGRVGGETLGLPRGRACTLWCAKSDPVGERGARDAKEKKGTGLHPSGGGCVPPERK